MPLLLANHPLDLVLTILCNRLGLCFAQHSKFQMGIWRRPIHMTGRADDQPRQLPLLCTAHWRRWPTRHWLSLHKCADHS